MQRLSEWRRHAVGMLLIVLAIAVLWGLPGLAFRPVSSVINLPVLDRLTTDKALVFAGYAGCSTVCNTALARLSLRYRDLPEDLQRQYTPVFLNVFMQQGQRQSDLYAQRFDRDFVAAVVDPAQQQALYQGLSLTAFGPGENPADHAGWMYLIERISPDSPWTLRQVFFSLSQFDHFMIGLASQAHSEDVNE